MQQAETRQRTPTTLLLLLHHQALRLYPPLQHPHFLPRLLRQSPLLQAQRQPPPFHKAHQQLPFA